MKKILIALVFIATAVSAAEFTRSEYQPDLTLGARRRIAQIPAFYPEVQYKYGLFQNFSGTYIDRPLFYDRALRPERFSYMTKESYFRDIAIMKQYGFDGSGSLALGIFHLYKTANDYLDSDSIRATGHYEYPQFAFGEMGKFSADAKAYKEACEILKIAIKSPFAPKINGKIPISTYNSAYIKPEIMTQFLSNLRQEFGETFSIFGGLVIDWNDQKNNEWTPEQKQKYQVRISEVLTLFDGIQLSLGLEKRDSSYMTNINFTLYDKYIIPMLTEILAKPEFKDKLLACCLRQGYINHMSGVSHGESGTARLRYQLDRVIKLNPDLVFCFEWNEFNENTCFQPTLANSMALQRIMRYYTNIMKKLPPEPNPGDDLNIPPLILTHRETLKIGEAMQFELLNVPDNTGKHNYHAQLSLHDLNGNERLRFPQEAFDRSTLKAVTFSVPTEQFPQDPVLIPRLTVTGADGKELTFKQFQYIRLLPTFCYNYKTVRHPLRDLLTCQASFQAQANSDGSFTLQGDVKANEPLAALEVTDYGREFYAVDTAREFDRENCFLIQCTFSTRDRGLRRLELELPHVDDWKFHPRELPNISFGSWNFKNGKMTSQTLIWGARTQFLVQVPKNFKPEAEIQLTVAGEKHSFPLAELVKNHAYAHVYQTCRADWQIFNNLPDTPVNINHNDARFKVTLTSDRAYPILQMRAVTVSGRIFRSTPVIPRKIPGDTVNLNLVSENTGKVKTAKVLRALVPAIKYRIAPASGVMLQNSCDPYFDAQLGGGFVYSEPGHYVLPDGRYAPEYTVDDGKPALRFDGTSNYVNLPLESFPRGPFTLQFSIKPEERDEPYILFRHYSWILGSVTVYAKFDRLWLAFGDRELQTHQFNSGLALPPGQWSEVEISYDYEYIRFKINGASREYQTAKPLQALYFKPAIWGGHNKEEFGAPAGAGFFKGLMRNLQITHNIEQETDK